MHFVVQQKARARSDDASAVTLFERVSQRDAIPLRVNDGQVRRFLAFAARDDVGAELAAGHRVVCVDLVAKGLDEIFRRELLQVDVNEIGVSEILRAIVKTDAHRFGQQMSHLGIAPFHSGEVIPFKKIQNLDDSYAARTRGRHPDDFISAIHSVQRRPDLRVVIREIAHRNDSAAGLNAFNQTPGQIAFVESVGAFFRNQLQSPCEIGQLHRLTGLIE